jgi:hypothetical protein
VEGFQGRGKPLPFLFSLPGLAGGRVIASYFSFADKETSNIHFAPSFRNLKSAQLVLTGNPYRHRNLSPPVLRFPEKKL